MLSLAIMMAYLNCISINVYLFYAVDVELVSIYFLVISYLCDRTHVSFFVGVGGKF